MKNCLSVTVITKDISLVRLLEPIFSIHNISYKCISSLNDCSSTGTLTIVDADSISLKSIDFKSFMVISEKEDILPKSLKAKAAVILHRPFQIREFSDYLLTNLKSSDDKTFSDPHHEQLLTYSSLTKTLHYQNHSVVLTTAEGNIVEYLLNHPGEIISTNELHGLLKNDHSNTVVAHISHIRKKAEAKFNIRFIVSAKNQGYYIRFPSVVKE